MVKAFVTCLVMLAVTRPALAAEALIAVAANFSALAERLEVEFESRTDHDITIAIGSTGSLYAQIRNGAPYDVFLAADQERPTLLEKSGNAVDGSRFTFAEGRLALWSADGSLIKADLQTTLRQHEIHALALANPALAPYGNASREALQSLGVWDSVRDKVVMGQNVGQVYALIATGNAQAGFVALSQLISGDQAPGIAYLPVPRKLHAPIYQDAVLLRHGRQNMAAIDFLAFLQSSDARDAISSNGYGVN